MVSLVYVTLRSSDQTPAEGPGPSAKVQKKQKRDPDLFEKAWTPLLEKCEKEEDDNFEMSARSVRSNHSASNAPSNAPTKRPTTWPSV